MASLPFMPVATDALIGDAGDLPNVLFGAYCRLLFRWWREGAEPEPNEKRLARWAGLTSSEFEDLKEFLTETPDGWVQKRLVETYARVREKSEKARQSANARKNGANAERTHDETSADGMLTKTKTTSYSKEYSGRARARKSENGKKQENVSRETPVVDHTDPECQPHWQAMRSAFGDAKLVSFFQTDGKPVLRKNCAGYVIEASGVRADRINQQFAPTLNDIFGKKNWRIETPQTPPDTGR